MYALLDQKTYSIRAVTIYPEHLYRKYLLTFIILGNIPRVKIHSIEIDRTVLTKLNKDKTHPKFCIYHFKPRNLKIIQHWAATELVKNEKIMQ